MGFQLLEPQDQNQNRKGPIIGMTIGALTISCVLVTLRMYTRLVIIKATRWDDWTIALALVLRHCLAMSNRADIESLVPL